MAKNIIKLSRGDSYEFRVDTNLAEADVAYFALLYPHQRFEDAILIKGYTIADQIDENGNNTCKILINIEPRDTKNLSTGIYYYTVKTFSGGTLNKNNGTYENVKEVKTVIERTKFIIND